MKKYRKILIIPIIFFAFLLISNYITYNSKDKLFSKSIFSINDNNMESSLINVNKLDEKITYETNINAGIDMCDYTLVLDTFYKDISTISFVFDKFSEDITTFTVKLYSADEIYEYNLSNLKNKALSNFIFTDKTNIEKIEISSYYQHYGTSKLNIEDYISINSIKINDSDDFNLFKKNVISKSLIYTLILVTIILAIYILQFIRIDEKIVKKFNLEKSFLCFSIIAGIVLSFLFPLYQIPDESAHINFIYEELGQNKNFVEAYKDYDDTSRIIRNHDEKINTSKYFNLEYKMDGNIKLSVPKITLIRHLPQAIGIVIGETLRLPILITITLCEILATIFYSFICYLSLKLMPFKKNILAFCMLIPVCLQQMGSFSYDVVLIPMCFLLISYILHLKFTKEKINLNDVLILLGILFVIFISKIPYVFLGLLVLILPLEKLDIDIFKLKINKKIILKYKWIIFVILAILGLIGIFVLSKISYGKVLLAAFCAPLDFLKMILRSINNEKIAYLQTLLGNFGWFDTPAPWLFIYFVVILGAVIIFCNYKVSSGKIEVEKQMFKWYEIVFILLMFIAMVFIIELSMYSWTLSMSGVVGADKMTIGELCTFTKMNRIFIGGVQGRYFVPFLPLIFLPLFSFKISDRIKKINPIFIQIIYYFIMVICMIVIVLQRYWI